MNATQLASNLYVLGGAVNTGVLVSHHKALLLDCCDTITPERLAQLGVERVDMILCTQHRRPNTAGACRFVEAGAKLAAPAGERHLLADPAAWWNTPSSRWHIYHSQPGLLVPARAVEVDRGVREGDVIQWEGTGIRVLDTPGATDGSVSYLLEADGTMVCFSGDAIYGPGQMWDFHSLNKGYDGIWDYHSFLGNRRKLIPSLKKLTACGAEMLVPSHGEVIRDVGAAVDLLLDRLDVIWRNYTAISCINHYFPGYFDDTKDDPWRMEPAATREPPGFVRRVACTSFAVISESGSALLTDCGGVSVIETLQQWLQNGTIRSVDGCWVTHYHDDHVDALDKVPGALGCPIITVEQMAEIIGFPRRFLLPCISPTAVPVARKVKDGESWRWHEFTLTAFHFPGQTYYHGGLLVEGHGAKVFFAGDSGSPTGIDDHCCGNRNFLGAGRGFRRCIEIWREQKPDYILNQHQELAFSFTDDELDHMDNMLAERERLFAGALPWAHPNFGTDLHWVRTYPYQQEVGAGASFSVDAQFTNHGPDAVAAKVEPALPDAWDWDQKRSTPSVWVPPRTDGCVDGYCTNPDKAAHLWISTPENEAPGQYVIPLRITWGDRYLGQFRHAIVVVR